MTRVGGAKYVRFSPFLGPCGVAESSVGGAHRSRVLVLGLPASVAEPPGDRRGSASVHGLGPKEVHVPPGGAGVQGAAQVAEPMS